MKRLRGHAAVDVRAPSGEVLSVLAAVDQYPSWHPDVVRDVEVLATGQDGSPTRAKVSLHVSHGPLTRDFKLLMDVGVAPPGRVTLTRVPNDASDQEQLNVAWAIDKRGEATRIELAVEACLAVPRFAPLGAVGDDLAQGFVSAVARRLQPAA